MGKWVAVMLGALCFAGPAVAHEKRADKCGCHHQYGLRHCHPKKKTKSCEAPVKATVQKEDEDHDHEHEQDHEHPQKPEVQRL